MYNRLLSITLQPAEHRSWMSVARTKKSKNPNLRVSYCSGVCAVFWTTLRPPRLVCCATQHLPVPSVAERAGSDRVQANIVPCWTAIRQGAGQRAGCQMKQSVASLCSSLNACQTTKTNHNTCCHSSAHHSIWCLHCFKEGRKVLVLNESKKAQICPVQPGNNRAASPAAC